MPTIRTTPTTILPTPCSRCSTWLRRRPNPVPESHSTAKLPTSRASSPFSRLLPRRRPRRCLGVRRSFPTTDQLLVSASRLYRSQLATLMVAVDPPTVLRRLSSPRRLPSPSVIPAVVPSRRLTRTLRRRLVGLRHRQRCRHLRLLHHRARKELLVARDLRAGLLPSLRRR